MSDSHTYLFGPVPSRRLGRSLGVDLIPFKTCTMNCRFCQLGDSTCALSERKEYVPTADVLAELEEWKAAGGSADHITLAGSGEPTLHTGFGDILGWVKKNTNCPSVLLTNGSLLHLPDVRDAARLADKVKVTLSAWDEASFQQIHHPAQGVTFKQLVDGERAFREQYSGELSVEVFVVEGMNSAAAEIRKIAALVKTIAPDRIDLNTAVRPPADSAIQAVSSKRLAELALEFTPVAQVTASFKKQPSPEVDSSPDALLKLIRRHPATVEQLALDYNKSEADLRLILDELVASGSLTREERSGTVYYQYRG